MSRDGAERIKVNRYTTIAGLSLRWDFHVNVYDMYLLLIYSLKRSQR